MSISDLARSPKLARAFGFLFFVLMMAIGYWYNLTFIQFGLLDLGTRLIGMSQQGVSVYVAYLALITSFVAVMLGFLMMQLGWSEDFRIKLRLAFGAMVVQTTLTGLAPFVRGEQVFLVWVIMASIALGIAVPATFGMAVDLVPTRSRGYAAALITSLAYFPAAVLSSDWTIEEFTSMIIGLMVAGALGLGVLAFTRLTMVDHLAAQHLLPQFGRGRFVRIDRSGHTHIRRSLFVLLFFMFGVYFVDSLGFLRLADTPFFFQTAWQSPEITPRLLIGGIHVLAALIAGVLYSNLDERRLLLWVFGIFALVHLMYVFTIRTAAGSEPSLAMPLLYSLAVSLYTVVNFALWADISTPRTITRNTALGVALSAWTATFVSTALALQLTLRGVSLEEHLRIVDALALLLFLLVAGIIYFSPPKRRRPPRTVGKEGR